MEPLTLIDARMPATVERWLDAWLTTHTTRARMAPGLVVSIGFMGTMWTHLDATAMQHQDRAALVAYVVAWARA